MHDELQTTVAITSCDSYDADILCPKIDQLLKLVGGLDKYIQPGQKVLLNPNLLSAKAPSRAITTHPDIVAAVALEVRKLEYRAGKFRGLRRGKIYYRRKRLFSRQTSN
jgi:uncharacterized protein (DUF362 family)